MSGGRVRSEESTTPELLLSASQHLLPSASDNRTSCLKLSGELSHTVVSASASPIVLCDPSKKTRGSM